MGYSERPKYRAKRTTVHGQTFASKKEAKHYLIYRALEEAGQIKDLKTQVQFKIVIKGRLICSYLQTLLSLIRKEFIALLMSKASGLQFTKSKRNSLKPATLSK